MTLLILAAGMGSRFGGLKQMAPMGPNGEFIIDYSIYDAIKAGFDKVVFVIKEDLFDEFKNTIGKRVEGKIKTEYVFQKIDDIPVEINIERVKPWGTGHAILCCKNSINENFAIINADDFYGRDAFLKAKDFLDNTDGNKFGMVAYKAINTITENGSVKRGVCKIENNYLSGIDESTIEICGDHLHCTSLVNNNEFDIENERLVSMNMLLFTPKIFEYLENDFKKFFEDIKDVEKDEYLIPEVLDTHIHNNDITVEVIETNSKWYGVTYKEDTEFVKNAIVEFVKNGEYNKKLWE